MQYNTKLIRSIVRIKELEEQLQLQIHNNYVAAAVANNAPPPPSASTLASPKRERDPNTGELVDEADKKV